MATKVELLSVLCFVHEPHIMQDAMKIFRESLRIFESCLGRDHAYTADAIQGMAQIMFVQSQYPHTPL